MGHGDMGLSIMETAGFNHFLLFAPGETKVAPGQISAAAPGPDTGWEGGQCVSCSHSCLCQCMTMGTSKSRLWRPTLSSPRRPGSHDISETPPAQWLCGPFLCYLGCCSAAGPLSCWLGCDVTLTVATATLRSLFLSSWW